MNLTTSRLTLRRFTRDDLPLFMALNSDPELMRYLGGVLDRAQSEEMLENRILKYYDEHPGLGIWALCLATAGNPAGRGAGDCIGMMGLNEMHGEPLVQLGFRVAREHWGKGYASEMGIALMRYGFVDLGLPLIVANTMPGNAASIRVIEKCGLKPQGLRTFAHPKYAKFGALACFERRAGDWLAEFGNGESKAA